MIEYGSNEDARVNTFRRVRRACDAYRRSRHDGSPEWIIVVAIAGILLSVGDSICSWCLDWLAPSLANRFNALEKG